METDKNIISCWHKHIVDTHFSRAPPLDRQDSLLFREKFIIFGKFGVATYFIFILKEK